MRWINQSLVLGAHFDIVPVEELADGNFALVPDCSRHAKSDSGIISEIHVVLSLGSELHVLSSAGPIGAL